MDIRQFKLTNDEEIICEVVEWNDDEHDTMVVRGALKIIAIDDTSHSMRYYTFKPWMMMNNDPKSLQVLNSYHIVSECAPTKVALEHYRDVISEMVIDDIEEQIEEIDMKISEALIGDSVDSNELIIH